jgi:hypothetical protein
VGPGGGAILAQTVKGKGTVADIEAQEVFHRILDLLQAGVTKLQHLAALRADQVVVLTVLEGLLKLGHILPELVLDHQVAVQQQFDRVVQGGPAHPVFVVFHFDVEGLHIEMAIGQVNFPQDGKPFWRFAVTIAFQIRRKNAFYGFKNILFALVHPGLISSTSLTGIKIEKIIIILSVYK